LFSVEDHSCILDSCVSPKSVGAGGICVSADNCKGRMLCTENRCIPNFSEDLKAAVVEFRDLGKRYSDNNNTNHHFKNNTREQYSFLACTNHGDCRSGYCNKFSVCSDNLTDERWSATIATVFPFVAFFLVMLPITIAFSMGSCCFEGMGACGNDWDHSE